MYVQYSGKQFPPQLRNNLSAVKQRQEQTNSDAQLKGKGTSQEAVDTIFLDQIKKGYMEEITDLTDINCKDCNYIPYFPVVRLDK
jgi:hypothetical protein